MIPLLLAPLRGVTVRAFREAFAGEIAAAGFTEAVTPFIPALRGIDPLCDRELRGGVGPGAGPAVTPQFIGKDPGALRDCLERVKDGGFATADLNCGCPFPMVRGKGRGSGLLKTPDLLKRMLEAGCSVMGPGRFSVKTRLGVDTPDELEALLPVIDGFPLRFLTVHGRIARQMYGGVSDRAAVARIAAESKVPVVLNGDVPFPPDEASGRGFVGLMIGRGFVRSLGARADSRGLLRRYTDVLRAGLCGDRPVLGRVKELVSYWKDAPGFWRARWPALKLCATVGELMSVI